MFVYFLYVLSLFVYFYLYLYFSLYLYLRPGWRSDSYPFPWLGGWTHNTKGLNAVLPSCHWIIGWGLEEGANMYLCIFCLLCVCICLFVYCVYFCIFPRSDLTIQTYCPLLVPQDNRMKREQMCCYPRSDSEERWIKIVSLLHWDKGGIKHVHCQEEEYFCLYFPNPKRYPEAWIFLMLRERVHRPPPFTIRSSGKGKMDWQLLCSSCLGCDCKTTWSNKVDLLVPKN